MQNQRERILAAVADVSSSSSYADMSVEDIIGSAGISRRTFYEHFKNKHDAFIAAYDEAADRLLAAVEAARLTAKEFGDRVRSGIETFLTLLAADPSFARMCIVEVMAAGPDAVARRNKAMHSFGRMFDEDAKALLNRRPPSALTAETVVGGIYDVIYNRIQQGAVHELPTLTTDLAYTALLPYLGPEAARRSAEAATVTPRPARTGPAGL